MSLFHNGPHRHDVQNARNEPRPFSESSRHRSSCSDRNAIASLLVELDQTLIGQDFLNGFNVFVRASVAEIYLLNMGTIVERY